MKISQVLKEFINKHKKLINDNEFDKLYDKADILLMGDYFDLTTLLNSIGINPLEYMSFVPNFYMEDFKDLEEIEIPEGIKIIGMEAFYRCISLKKVYLPSTLQAIETAAFGDCDNLIDVYFNGTTEQWSRLPIGRNNYNLYCANIHCTNGELFKT